MNRFRIFQRGAATLLAGGFTLIAGASLSSCGYTSHSLYNLSVRTVAVPIFTNKTFRREWEFRLTEAIDKNIEYRTPYKLAPRKTADTILTGEIVSIQENVLTRRYGTILPRESQLTVVVNFTWRDARSGRVIVSRRGFNRSATEIPQINENVDDAEQLAIERLAEGIVDQMQKSWDEGKYQGVAASEPALTTQHANTPNVVPVDVTAPPAGTQPGRNSFSAPTASPAP